MGPRATVVAERCNGAELGALVVMLESERLCIPFSEYPESLPPVLARDGIDPVLSRSFLPMTSK